MREKLRFRLISRITLPSEEEEQIQKEKEGLREVSKKDQQVTEKSVYPVYDVILESLEIDRLKPFNTDLRQTEVRGPVEVPPMDLHLTKVEIEPPDLRLITQVRQVQVPEIKAEVADLKLYEPEVEVETSSWNTELMDVEELSFEHIPIVDLTVESEFSLEQERKVDTRLEPVEEVRSIESLFAGGGEGELPILEELIGFKKKMRIPRSFGESSDSPIVVLIGEGGESEWHIPILYVLNELFREITDRYPKVTFREPDEDNVDSLEPHSLDRFTFAGKIEFLDSRKELFDVKEFARTVRGRLNSAFLQQFGVLAIAVEPQRLEPKRLERVKNALKLEGVKLYTCSPDEGKYKEICAKVIGVSIKGGEINKFLDMLELYKEILDETLYKFSVFVKRDTEAADGRTDRQQYPLKVATFMALLNEVRERKKKVLKDEDFEGLCEFVREIKEQGIIKIEESPKNSKDVTDLVYSPFGDEVYVEIETLIGTLEPMKKIDETVDKYHKCQIEGKIWIILRPVSAILHYEELKRRERAYRVLYGRDVKFKVLNLDVRILPDRPYKPFRWKLVDLDKFIIEVCIFIGAGLYLIIV
ncbi:MAG: hypothetical protein DRN95_05865 [Candidatus Hydrothermarchaeota archaeon]|nr:MAG: hypothetical protein DRN95_05865 [Candidatus Hydrothermarchaeota archaeon]